MKKWIIDNDKYERVSFTEDSYAYVYVTALVLLILGWFFVPVYMLFF